MRSTGKATMNADREEHFPDQGYVSMSVKVWAKAVHTYAPATNVSPAENDLEITDIDEAEIEIVWVPQFDEYGNDIKCAEKEHSTLIDNLDAEALEALLALWGIDLWDQNNWEMEPYDGPDGPDPDDQRDLMLESL